MSLLDDASLVVVPSGYKAGTVYSVKPTNGDGDLSFTRSNDTATRVNSAGLIEKVRTNVLLESNSFDTTWATSDSSVTSGQAGYDGTNNAWTLQSTSTNASSVLQSPTSSGVHTLSVYAKAGTVNFIRLSVFGATSYSAYFNVSDGSVGVIIGSVINTKIEAVGNGFYRCSIAVNESITSLRIYVSSVNGALTSGIGDNVYIQDAQLELGDIATDYIPTTTTAVSVGMLANVPRLDYSGGGCPKLLLEPQRTNLVTFSEQFDNAAWSKSAVTVTANATTSPDGYTNADKLIATAVSGFHNTSQSIGSKIALTPYTFSFFAKADEISFCLPNISSAFSGTQLAALINLSDGTISSVSAGLSVSTEDYGNGWYRIKLTATSQNNTSGFLVTINATNESGASNFTGDGTSGIFIWGAQLEEGSYVSSYIPTYGAAVTRGQDACSKTGISSLIGQTEGTLFAEFNSGEIDAQQYFLGINTDISNRIIIFKQSNNTIQAQVRKVNIAEASFSTSAITANTDYKVAISYEENNVNFFVNGVLIGRDSAVSIPACSNFTFDDGDGDRDFYRPIKSVLLFPTALTDTQCIELTTL